MKGHPWPSEPVRIHPAPTGSSGFEADAGRTTRIAEGDHKRAARQFVEEVVFGPETWLLQSREGSSELAPSSRGCSSSDAGARGWTVDSSARICTRERRPLSFGAPSRAHRAVRPGHVASARPIVGRRESLVSAGSGLRVTLRRAAGAAAARTLRLRSLLRSGRAARVPPRSAQAQLSRPRRNRSRCRRDRDKARDWFTRMGIAVVAIQLEPAS
jgi:hypothetical protein